MPLWGAVEGSEALPKFLTTAQQKDVYANQSGWVVEAGSAMTGNGNTSADPEILVAIGGLAGASGTTGLGEATIQSVNWNITTFDNSAGGTLIQFMLDGIAGNFRHDDEDSLKVLDLIFKIEDTLVESGDLSPHFAMIVAQPSHV